MDLRALLISIRERAGLSQRGLGRRSSWLPENISKFERGEKGASLESIEDWVNSCGFELIGVRVGAADSREVDALPAEHRTLVLRLARLFPHLSDERIDTIRGLVERWEDQLVSSTLPTDPDPTGSGVPLDDNAADTAQDKLAKSS